MKYIGAFCMMLFCDEVMSPIALTLVAAFIIGDILKARCER